MSLFLYILMWAGITYAVVTIVIFIALWFDYNEFKKSGRDFAIFAPLWPLFMAVVIANAIKYRHEDKPWWK